MCSVSMVLDYGQKVWPLIDPVTPLITEPLKEWAKLLEQAKVFDKVAKQPDCEDPEKVKWLEAFMIKLNDLGCRMIVSGNQTQGLELIQLTAGLKAFLKK